MGGSDPNVENSTFIFFIFFEYFPKRLCCCGRRPISPESEDRIEHAFRKMDPNNTGYVTWKEFKKVVLSH